MDLCGQNGFLFLWRIHTHTRMPASTQMSTFWSVTINNPDENDWAIIRNGYQDYCREIVHTKEVGEDGTEHIQAWVKLQRQQRFSFVKKLFPRAHLRCLNTAEYVQHTKEYCQKNDDTTAGKHIHTFNDPLHTIENVIKKVAGRILFDLAPPKGIVDHGHLNQMRVVAEREMVKEDYKYAKIFVSSTYKQMWKLFGWEMVDSLNHEFNNTHTHTHTTAVENDRESSVIIDTTNADDTADRDTEGLSQAGGTENSQAEDDEYYEESACEGDVGTCESVSDRFSESTCSQRT